MAFGDVLRKKEEILSQYRVLGVPTEEELKISENVIHVNSYTREDGTEVEAHYRSKPRGGSVVSQENVNIKSAEPNTEKNAVDIQNEDNYVNESMPEIAGVKCGKPMTPEQAGGKNVNPNYDSGDIGYKLNCSACAAVHKAREIGYNIQALPVTDKDCQEAKMLRKYPYYAYEMPNNAVMESPTKYRSNNAAECLQNVQQHVKPNEKYIFWYQPIDGEDKLAHVIEVYRNKNNDLEFYDGQNGMTYGKEYIDKIKFKNDTGSFYPQFIFRTDNKLLKNNVMNKISKPAQ